MEETYCGSVLMIAVCLHPRYAQTYLLVAAHPQHIGELLQHHFCYLGSVFSLYLEQMVKASSGTAARVAEFLPLHSNTIEFCTSLLDRGFKRTTQKRDLSRGH
jgi:hypothetical protein